MANYPNITIDAVTVKEINDAFRQLVADINATYDNLVDLDLVKIATIFTPDPAQDILAQFITSAWAGLAVYSGVYCNMGSQTFRWNNQDIYTGDYLVKQPDGNSLYIPGGSIYYYIPTTYSTASGNLQFTLQTVSPGTEPESPVNIVVPQWITGSNTGHVAKIAFDVPVGGMALQATYDAQIPLTSVQAARYFYGVNGGLDEEIVFNSEDITIDETNHTITLPFDLNSYPLPMEPIHAYIHYNCGDTL